MGAPDEHANELMMPLRPRLPTEVRASFAHGYTVTDILSALPARSRIDVTALPADLQLKAQLHGDDLDSLACGDHRTRTNRGRRATRYAARAGHVLATLGAFAAAGYAAVQIAALAAYHLHITTSPQPSLAHVIIPLLSVPVLYALARYSKGVSTRSKQPVYTPDEIAVLDNATIDWPAVPEDLDPYPNREVLQQQWRQRWTWRIEPGAAALVWREPHMVALANLIARDIRASRAWRSELFDIHRVRIDLDRTLADVTARAHRIWQAYANLVTPPNGNPNSIVARRNDEIRKTAERAWTSLVELVEQLHDYKTELAPIEAIVAEIEAIDLSALRVSDDAVRQLDIDAAGNEFTSNDVKAATSELDELNANLAARLDALHHALGSTTSVLTVVA